MKNVYVTREIPVAGLDLLRKEVNVEINPHDRVLKREELLRAVAGRDGVLCLLTDAIDAEVFDAARGAKVFANYAVGFNNIDVAAATKRGICVTNTPGVLTDATADMAWTLLMAITRRVVESDRFTREGKFDGWGPKLFIGGDIAGRTLGIVGLGRIGSAVAKRATGFDMQIVYTDLTRNPEFESKYNAKYLELPALLESSDFVSIHAPLTPETRHMIDAKALKRMKRSAYLINTARGPLVDEKALVVALKERWIAGAALDVYEQEPKLEPGLVDLPNVVVCPHICSATAETRDRMATMAAGNLLDVLSGRTPRNPVNPEVLQATAPQSSI